MATIAVPVTIREHWLKLKAEEFGFLRAANVALTAVAIATITGMAFTGYELHQAAQKIADFRPYYVRISDLGKAEVVYNNASYERRSPEVLRALGNFTAAFFSRMKGRTDEYWNSKYMLSQQLQSATWQDDQKTEWIKKLQSGQGPTWDIKVTKVAPITLTDKGGMAYVDFTKTYYESGTPLDKQEFDTVTYYFEFANDLKGKMLEYNPIGLVITDYHVNEDFH